MMQGQIKIKNIIPSSALRKIRHVFGFVERNFALNPEVSVVKF